jgi:hypothetical protein
MDTQGNQRIIHETNFHSAQSYNQRVLARQYCCRYILLFLMTYYLNTDTAHTEDIWYNFKSIIPSNVCHWLFTINIYFLLNNRTDALIIQIYSVITCSILLCLEAVIKTLHETCQCRMNSKKLLVMGRKDARNM